jgi:uncharacterized protein YbjQ (UPF0145 family)
MNRVLTLLVTAMLIMMSANADARTTIHYFDIADILENPAHASRLQGVEFYFGNQPHPAPVRKIGERRTNKKTNAFNKSDREACEWVMLSALLAMHKAATNAGANAVVNIRSNFKNNLFVSETQYSCGAGAMLAGVALIGDLIVVE